MKCLNCGFGYDNVKISNKVICEVTGEKYDYKIDCQATHEQIEKHIEKVNSDYIEDLRELVQLLIRKEDKKK
jgi:hypothetical protein